MAASSSMISIEAAANSSRPEVMRLITASGIDRLPHHREFHSECCALTRATLYPDLAGVLLDDAVGHRQPKSGAAGVSRAGFALGGKKRIVDAMNVLLRDPRTRIRNYHFNVVTVPCTNHQCA